MDRATAKPDATTLFAFGTMVVIGGINFVAVRFSNRELPPMFGAALRMAIAAVLLLAIMRLRRLPFPRGNSLIGAVGFGTIGIAAAYALLYWSLGTLSASVGSIVMASVPLLTTLLVPLHRLETFRRRGLVGSILVIGGIVVMANPTGAGLPVLPLLAALAAALAASEGGILLKQFPATHPVATNATAMVIAAVMLAGASLAAGEAWALPTQTETWVALIYMSVVGTVVFFGLLLFVLARWTASASSYVAALMPIVATIAGSVIANEPITLSVVLGGAVVLLGVWVGAFSGSAKR